MDVVTDLSSQCVSYITVFQEICKTPLAPQTADAGQFSFFLLRSRTLTVDPKTFGDSLKRRISEMVWSRKELTPNSDFMTNAIENFLDACKKILQWVDGFAKSHPDFKPAGLYSTPYEWRSCIKEILYAETDGRTEQRLSLVGILQYMPIQILLCLGANNLNIPLRLASVRRNKAEEQRLLQIWEPGRNSNTLSEKELKANDEWWDKEYPLRPSREHLPQGYAGDTMPRRRQAELLLQYDEDILAALLAEDNPVPFETLWIDELKEIVKSRKIRREVPSPKGTWDNIHEATKEGDPVLCAKCLNLHALAFSGGGIRSATFNLGILQKLAEMKLLARFDYLSTVSGGGYIGSWFEAWVRRTGSIGKVMDRMNPKKSTDPLADEVRPIRWLRMFSNYLAPNASLMSADSWTMGVTWLRNTIINQVILLLLLCSVLSFIKGVCNTWIVIHPQVFSQVSVVVCGALVLFSGAIIAGLGMNAFDARRDNLSTRLDKNNRLYYLLMIWGFVSTFLLSTCFYSYSLNQISFAEKLRDLHSTGWVGFFAFLLVALIGKYYKCEEVEKNPWKIFTLITVSSLIAAFCGLVLLCLSWQIFESIRCVPELVKHFSNDKLAFIVGVPLVLETISITVVVRMAILGVLFPDLRREWWGRMGALVHRFIFLWLLVSSCTLFLPDYFATLDHEFKLKTFTAIFGGWSAIIGYAVKLAYSSKTSGQARPDGSLSPTELFVKAAPYLFAVGFLLLGTITLRHMEQGLKLIIPIGQKAVFQFVVSLGLGALTFLLGWRVGVNEFSLHHFYRNRLARAYLGATRRREDREKTVNNFTGFDKQDDLLLTKLQVDAQYSGPYPILNATLNSTVVSDLDRQDRKAESFVFTPKYCGFDFCRNRPADISGDNSYEYGYRPTGKYAYPEGPHLSTAMTISGAAVSPNMGYHSSPAIAFLLTIFNVRLGWWMGNPRTKYWKSADPWAGIVYLIKDLFGTSDVNADYVCLSDGGHFDNMGLYELIRRRCSYIVLCDAVEDERSTCEDLANAIRRCRIDFGVEIALVVDPITNKDEKTKYSKQHLVKGTITYPGDGDNPSGTLIYIKTTLTGDESIDIRQYDLDNPAFPQQSTGDQFFDESQFESYRKLGYSSITGPTPETKISMP